MATEEYSVGYDSGYQDGWNAAIEQAQKNEVRSQEPVALDDGFDEHFKKRIDVYADHHPTLLVRQLATRLRTSWTSPPQRQPLTDEQLEKGRDQTFSINNPFCPCDSKTFRKVARWVEVAHGIKE